MNVKVGIYFCGEDGEKFFGAGPYRLLLGIRETGSLRSAAQRMGMAYSKAFAMMKRAEAEFGFPLTERTIGGKGGGGSMLTPGAKELIMRYEGYEAACSEMAQNLYHTHFSTFRPETFAVDGQ